VAERFLGKKKAVSPILTSGSTNKMIHRRWVIFVYCDVRIELEKLPFLDKTMEDWFG
jgi:hypothetical protein